MINLIAAVDKNNLIGVNGQLPWHLPADLAYFKEKTYNSTIVMGNKTFESIKSKPLPHRLNIVLSSKIKPYYLSPNLYFSNSVDLVLSLSKYMGDIWVIGGTQIFEQLLPHADCLYLTEIDHEFDADIDKDSYFPYFDKLSWRLQSSKTGVRDEKNPYNYSFNVYKKI